MVFQKFDFLGHNCTSKSPLLVDQSLQNFFFQRRGNAVGQLVFRFWISLSVPEIFALKVGRSPKSGQN